LKKTREYEKELAIKQDIIDKLKDQTNQLTRKTEFERENMTKVPKHNLYQHNDIWIHIILLKETSTLKEELSNKSTELKQIKMLNLELYQNMEKLEIENSKLKIDTDSNKAKFMSLSHANEILKDQLRLGLKENLRLVEIKYGMFLRYFSRSDFDIIQFFTENNRIELEKLLTKQNGIISTLNEDCKFLNEKLKRMYIEHR